MSCAALALSASLAMADLYAGGPAAQAAAVQAAGAQQVSPLASEPLYADIISRARRLEGAVAGFRATAGLKDSPTAVRFVGFDAFKVSAATLAELDMKGHFDLAARNTDGDLKCILKGISQDIPEKLKALEAAKTGAEQDRALDELAYLFNDNVGVITAPPKPPV
jgi:hypothetical protein